MVRYKPGDVVTVSSPFVFVLNSNERGARCDFCFRGSDSSVDFLPVHLKRCSNCKLSFYCNTKCQRSAWGKFHKDECPKLCHFTPETCPTETFIIFARLVSKILKRNGPSDTEDVLGVSRSFRDLKSHVEEIKLDSERLKQFDSLSRFLILHFPDYKYDMEQLMSVFGKMVINSYSICNSEMQSIGTGLYLGASIFDHSCDPNATVVYDGISLYVRAIKDIDSTSPRDIFINYIDPIGPTSERQKQLTEQYYFTCNCCTCLNNTVDNMKTEILEKEICLDFLEQCSTFVQNSSRERSLLNTDDKKKLLTQCNQKLNRIQKLIGDGHTLHVRMLDLMFDLCIDLQLWKESLEFGLSTIKYYRLYYNKYFPAIGIQLFKIGKIQHLLGELQKAREMFMEARQLLCVCYGRDHRLLKELEQFLDQCEVEINRGLQL